jgi:hypothetical protein
MILIAFAAKAGAGKTTAAKLLVEKAGFTRLSFAEPLYNMLEAGGFGRPKTFEEKEAIIPGLGFSWRHAATTLGTEWGRVHLGQNIWSMLALRKACDPDGRYVLDDCRFNNEAQIVREAGGHVVHILGRALETQASGHASEAGVNFQPEDYQLYNSGNMKALEISLEALLYAVIQQ